MIPLICCSVKQKCIGLENRSSVIARVWLLGAGKIDYKEDKRELLRMIKMFYILIVMVVIWLMYLSKLPEEYIIKGEFYCIKIAPQIIH